MSEENVEIARRLFEEFQAGLERGDPGAWFHSEAVVGGYEWIVPTPLDGRSVWRGRDGFVEFIPYLDRADRRLVDSSRALDRCQ
jgi:hypothetical protein